MSRFSLGAIILVALMPSSAWAGAALPPCSQTVITNCATAGTTATGFAGTVKGSTDGEFTSTGSRPRAPKAPLSPTYIDRDFTPTCTGNSADDSGVLCNAAVETCPAEGEVRFWVFETTINRATGRPLAGTGPRLVDTVCLGADAPVLDPAVAIPAMVQSEFKSVVVLTGAAQVSPKPETLVNIPTRFKTDAPASYQIPLTLLGRSVVITATAQRFIWHVDEGLQRVSTRPDGYLEHEYARAGDRDVRVDIEWSGTFSVSGGPPQPITGTVVTAGEPVQVQVQQARSELVRD